MAMSVYEKINIGGRRFTIYERTRPVPNSRPTWEVWETVEGRGVRRVNPSSRKKCYDFINSLDGVRIYDPA